MIVECLSVADACRASDGIGRTIFPSPGGGMYGDDVVYLLGGSLLRELDRIGETIKEMRARLT